MIKKYDPELAMDAFRQKDYQAVLKLAQPCAEAGDPNAQCMLSLLYQAGLGVKQDVRQNSALAWHNLGSLYALRLPGLSRGPEAARECYKRAKELGFDCAQPYPPPGYD